MMAIIKRPPPILEYSARQVLRGPWRCRLAIGLRTYGGSDAVLKVIKTKAQKIGPILFWRNLPRSDREQRTKIRGTAQQLEGAPMNFMHRSTMALCFFLLCAAMSVAAILPASAEKRIALVVGNSAYRNVPPLTNPANDAKLIADTLQSLGFELVGGSAQLDLDKPGFEAIVKRFGTMMQGAELASSTTQATASRCAERIISCRSPPIRNAKPMLISRCWTRLW